MYSFITSASVIGLSCLSAVVSAAPFSFANNPLGNGFPNVANPSNQLTNIEVEAHGSLPNGGPPSPPNANSLTSLRLIAFNELFEVAYFTDLKSNITNNVRGYQIFDEPAKLRILEILTAIQAQEELHALNANEALAAFGGSDGAIMPCKYTFPVTNFEDAIALASKFTDVVLGTLQDVQTQFSTDGDTDLISLVASVIGQEGEQNGFFRLNEGLVPSALPFLTASTREFAFSALNQNFIVPNSCPNINTIDLPIFAPLAIDTPVIEPRVQNIQFSFAIPSPVQSASDFSDLSLVYINQLNTPVVETLQQINIDNKNLKVTFEAAFPFNQATFGNGLTIAALTNGAGPFASADAVAAVTKFGPALIEIN